jgi:hypothetical protein
VHHDASLLLERHPRHEIPRPPVWCEAPILIGIEHAVPIQIPELQSVLLKNRRLNGEQQRGEKDRPLR